MELVKNQTRFTHKTMISWGEGVFKGYDGNGYLVIEFGKEGEKKFAPNAIGKLLVQKEDIDNSKIEISTNTAQNDSLSGHLIQFDGESDVIGGKNVISSFESEDTLLFNESYIAVGPLLRAKKIHAMYDLTVIGDLNVSECVVNGSLIVVGNVTSESLNCANSCIIQGEANIEKIYVGGNFIANSVKCENFLVDENAIIRTTIDVNKSAEIEKTIVACEGIIGAGFFTALNAIANEYFEFDGKVSGNILELETDTIISKNEENHFQEDNYSLSELIIAANKIINSEYEKCPDYEEEIILNILNKVESDSTQGWLKGPDNEYLFKKLIDISYNEKIETLEDYLYVLLAKKTLPSNLYKYETVDFVDTLIHSAEEGFEELVFIPASLEQFIRAVDMAIKCSDISGIEHGTLFDKLFEAIGLKYNTVKGIFHRNGILGSSKTDSIPNSSNNVSLDFQEEGFKSEEHKEKRESILKKMIAPIMKK